MVRIRKPALALAAVLLASLALSACATSHRGAAAGSGPSSASTSSSAPTSKCPTATSASPTVTIKGFAFSPACLTVKPGTKVKFINEDPVTHTATATGAKTINSGNLAKGQSYTYTFTKAGTYSYICEIHQYMHGTITVT